MAEGGTAATSETLAVGLIQLAAIGTRFLGQEKDTVATRTKLMQLDVPYVTSISDAAIAIGTTKLDASARSSGKKVTQGSLDKKDGEAYCLLEAIIDAFESVRAALADPESFHPDLLLSDIGMLEEDGYALIRHVRARETATGGTCPRSPSRPLPASPTAKRRWALKSTWRSRRARASFRGPWRGSWGGRPDGMGAPGIPPCLARLTFTPHSFMSADPIV